MGHKGIIYINMYLILPPLGPTRFRMLWIWYNQLSDPATWKEIRYHIKLLSASGIFCSSSSSLFFFFFFFFKVYTLTYYQVTSDITIIFQALGRNLCSLNGSLVYRKFSTYTRHHKNRYTDLALTHGPSVLAVDAVRVLYHTVNLTASPLRLTINSTT